jgi:catechol 2,3-dioxygenase
MTQVADQPDTTTRTDPSIKCPTLHHYGIWSTQPDVLLDWYGKVVGIECNLRSQSGYGPDADEKPLGLWVSNDRAHHRMAIARTDGMQKLDPAEKIKYDRLGHSAWEYPSVTDLMESYERIRDLGIRPVLCVHHGLSVAFYYHDPDGNVVELTADAFGDWERSREYMRTSADMRANTMGTYIDPDRMLAAHREGASDDTLQSRAFTGEFVPDETPDPRQLL